MSHSQRPEYRSFDPLRRDALHRLQDVGVDIQRHPGARVPETVADRLHAGAGRHREARERVARAVAHDDVLGKTSDPSQPV